MKVDELIKQKAEELHRVHAHDSGRLEEFRARARPRRRSQVWVLVGAALAVLLLLGPVALFLRSEDPSNSAPDANTPTADGDPTPPQASGDVSVSDRLFEVPGDGGLGPVMTSGSDLIVTGFDIVLRSADGGDTWEETGSSPSGDDSLILTEAADGTLLAVGAHDGASSRLYRSGDYGATWEQFEVPTPSGIDQIVAGDIAHRAGQWIIAGVATQSSFDNHAVMYVWKSPDAANWDFEEVADLEGRFAYIDAVEVVDNRVVVLARSAQDTALDLFAMEEADAGWSRTELTPILESQAGLPSKPVNTLPKGAGIVGDRLHAWWSFADGSFNHLLAATVYRTGPGEWGAEPTTGVAPETVTITADGLIGTAHPGTLVPTLTPGFTAIVTSNDGITWSEIGRVDGLYLRQLAQMDNGQFIAAGNETEATDEEEATDEGVTVPSSGIWNIELSDDPADTLGSP